MKPATHKVHPSVPYADEIALLGGKAVVGKEPSSPYEVHDLVEHGLPARAALRLLEHFPAPPEAALITALGLTPRTLARRRADPTRRLDADQSARAWRLSRSLAHAIRIFGTKAEAEAWLARPAMGLSQRRPIDLFSTAPGAELVERYLTQIEYGVYT